MNISKKTKNKLLCLGLMFLLVFSGCSPETENSELSDSFPTPPSPVEAHSNRPTRPVNTTVTLSDSEIQIDGTGAQADGSTLTITADGVYEIKGSLSDGQILINANDTTKVELLLSGVDIASSKSSAIYCINADDFIISLADGTENKLTDAVSYTYDDEINEEPNAALFSKVDMNIGGDGSLTINSNFQHGISSKDDLVIEGGSFDVKAVSHGIRGRDSLTILNGNFNIEAGGDGLQSSNIERADYGWVLLSGGQYNLKVSGDGIQAETSLTIQGGTYDITTSGTPMNDSTSQKGLKAGTILTVEDGDFKINSIDDAVHSNTDIGINGGTFAIYTRDDGIHADRKLNISGGTIDIPECYEGFEGTVVEISGGKSFISSTDDAISAAGGTDDTQGDGARRAANKDVYVRITGGEVEAVSRGDTIDANGYVYVEGGTLRLSAPIEPSWEGAILCNGDVTFTGGNVAVSGRVGVGVAAESQPVLLISHISQQAEGSVVSLRDQSGHIILEHTSRQAYSDSAFSCPEMQVGSTYGIYVDGEKKINITLQETITKISDDGSEFKAPYPRTR